MNLLRPFLQACCGCAVWAISLASGEVPRLLHHQGRMAVEGVPFDGTGQFKFALLDGTGTTSYWSHDGTSTAGSEPTAALSLPVSRGLYAVLLGDTGMTAVPAGIFTNADVRLRVWFNDGSRGFQKIAPDQRLVAAPYALAASRVDQVLLEDIEAPPIHPVVAWGRNSQGQTTVPLVLSGANTAAISARGNLSLALLKDGTVVRWGGGAAVPAGLTGVTAISAGVEHALALKNDGTVAAWGGNTFGQATTEGITNATAIAAGEKHSIILHQGGTVTVLGDNTFGQIPAAPLTGVTTIAAGHDHGLALTAGRVEAWGRNDTGQADVPPAGLSDVVAIAAGAYHSLAVKSDGTVVAWGWNSGGQCDVPAGLTQVRAVAAGYSFSAALKHDGTVICWGDTTDGQSPVPVGATQLTAIAAGDSHVLALHADLMPAQVARLDQPNTFAGKLGIRRAAATNTLEVEGNASKSSAGNWLANSDRRIKTDIRTLDGALEKIDRVRLVDFRYTGDYLATHPGLDGGRYLNVIAQEFAEVFPQHVKGSGERLPDGSEVLQVDTYPLTIFSAAAIQELHQENKLLHKKLADQEERLRRLEQKLER